MGSFDLSVLFLRFIFDISSYLRDRNSGRLNNQPLPQPLPELSIMCSAPELQTSMTAQRPASTGSCRTVLFLDAWKGLQRVFCTGLLCHSGEPQDTQKLPLGFCIHNSTASLAEEHNC